ncbi:serine phosphatase RsbU (regulator of sigma subunit) [Streptomyces griseochromogenes]|uniref:Serine phosphatase RsbU (Regulator of sigma subunit) n=1 Tax=Streptomyces griseochromogenes TaxID=68214 RepID=A0ABS4LK01_9ACTN|nr:PP2C family protein-serine/threonine phosphatase [Streptomyces griseochromogenes]MBP2047713.1 serine phosphatase RsbU (regulator of sigma subunit) [Streptomyces griseochromogenes]
MDVRRSFAGVRRPWQSSHALLLIPIVLILVITVTDQLVPADVHLGPLLVIAPALTASFAGPGLTGLIGFLAVGAQMYIGWHFGVLFSRNVLVQILALTVLSAMTVFYCVMRERRLRQLAQVRMVAEAAQHVLLWPLPEQIGSMKIACLYLAAEAEAQIGGDLYAATPTDSGVRVMIGDVRGKGLSAIGEAALLIGAFRESAHHHTTLPALAAALEQSVARNLPNLGPEEEMGERFATVMLLEIPDDGHISRILSCGHPPPLLLAPGGAVTVPVHPAPPLGIQGPTPGAYTVDVFTFEPTDTLLLYTDGVIEARDADGVFYPLMERAAQWAGSSPEKLLHHVRRDLLDHVGGRLNDDAALIALCHASSTPRVHRHGPDLHLGGFGHGGRSVPH